MSLEGSQDCSGDPLLGCLDRLLGRFLGWLLKNTILGLVGLEALGVVSLRKMLLWGKLTPLQHLIQLTLKVGTGVLVPTPKPSSFLNCWIIIPS